MADLKISQLVSATTVNTTDLFVMVQGGSTVKVDIATFLSKLPASPTVVQAQEAPGSGALSTAIRSSLITSATGTTNYTLAAGTHGQQKLIGVQTLGASALAVVTVSSQSFGTLGTITFNAVGDSVLLENINGIWFIVGSNSVVLA